MARLGNWSVAAGRDGTVDGGEGTGSCGSTAAKGPSEGGAVGGSGCGGAEGLAMRGDCAELAEGLEKTPLEPAPVEATLDTVPCGEFEEVGVPVEAVRPEP